MDLFLVPPPCFPLRISKKGRLLLLSPLCLNFSSIFFLPLGAQSDAISRRGGGIGTGARGWGGIYREEKAEGEILSYPPLPLSFSILYPANL